MEEKGKSARAEQQKQEQRFSLDAACRREQQERQTKQNVARDQTRVHSHTQTLWEAHRLTRLPMQDAAPRESCKREREREREGAHADRQEGEGARE